MQSRTLKDAEITSLVLCSGLMEALRLANSAFAVVLYNSCVKRSGGQHPLLYLSVPPLCHLLKSITKGHSR